MRGLGLGPDASQPTQYLMAAMAPMTVDEIRAAMGGAGCLAPEMVEAMVTCFSPDLQPGNVASDTYNAFCLKNAAAGSFDLGGCQPAVTNWLDATFPLPQCFDDPTVAAMQYCGQHPDYQGPNRVNDAICWLAQRSDSYALRIYGTPGCSSDDGAALSQLTAQEQADLIAYAAAVEAQEAADAAAAAQAAADAAAQAQADAATQAAADAAAAAAAAAADQAAVDAAAAAAVAQNGDVVSGGGAGPFVGPDGGAVTNGEDKKRSSMMLMGLLVLGVVGVGAVGYMVTRKK